ncbi:DoxX family protein [Prochlorococcus marinus]|uniref:DoxX family membrane protein n=1 Tax=Prochlorococcus marinus XMU1408 TaxID=2213228 RepID=A0A318R1A6_PROMR|nr:DoxX family protein [Prochlorococcus marinus]MBW3042549.1 DoxX family membrane protein [Prochlorococcus marinus str. XMU1408]PYE01273.1 DoxX family membrane protein [Prochlorococcus marinus XMU1408]
MNSEKVKNLIGRILISAIFIYAIPTKIINFEQTIEVLINKNIHPIFATFLLFSAIICLIFGSILFMSGFKQRLGAYLLLIFIVPTTFIFHFSPFQTKSVLMNAGLIGGLVLGLNKVTAGSLKDLFNNQKIHR